MSESSSSPEAQTPAAGTTPAPALSERGWGKMLIALVLFVVVPMIPHVRAILPFEDTMLLFVPALAACTLVGWWAGGRAFLAIVWVGLAVGMAVQPAAAGSSFYNLERGWSLLLAGSFGLVCLLNPRRGLFGRASIALCMTLVLAAIMSLVGPVTMSQASKTVAEEFTRRNTETMAKFRAAIDTYPQQWQEMVAKVPTLADMPAETDKQLSALASAGVAVFPALLALQSLAALALAWATYHRLSRARLGNPLRPLREFRFNDQLVWGLIVGLTIVLLPTLSSLRGVGKNLLVFFGALYAMRGFGVLAWFIAPGSLGVTLAVATVMLFAPVLQLFAALAFMLVGVGALVLGLGDTWADWRRRTGTPTL
ncbi:MAG TPA: DUF2232 domain-containing protein [Gemmatimonadaceae bacterium]|nr:DUF2232 domain-containing protein [Gemmatimonadaceae bacterium]